MYVRNVHACAKYEKCIKYIKHKYIYIYILVYTHARCAPTHVDPRARLLSRMRKTIFGIQAASCTRGETLERRNYTRARVWACVRAGTRTRPAFDCILRIYSDEYTTRAIRLFLFFFYLPFFPFLPFRFSLFTRARTRARARTRLTAIAQHSGATQRLSTH